MREQSGASARLNEGQRATLRVIGKHLPSNGMVLADEVGMGKTRIAVQLIDSVVRSGGRVAVLIPSGLGYQWQRELRGGGRETEHVLRSIVSYMDGWAEDCPDPWHRRDVVVLSHAFSHWNIQATASEARWLLLPALVAVVRKREDYVKQIRKLPYGNGSLRAAQAIAKMLEEGSAQAAKELRQFAQNAAWAPMMRPESYAAGTVNRRMLMLAVGLGFGRFDLVVVDEAHKSRSKDSRLSRLLDEMLCTDTATRVLAMSATPVELDVEQWLQTLERIRVGSDRLTRVKTAIHKYIDALHRVRLAWRTSDDARSAYATAAESFQSELGEFVVRRDKREDADVALYGAHTHRNYRDTESQILINTEKLPVAWKQAVCASEALSLIRGGGSRNDKRLRTTFASGHGISKFLDEDEDEERRIAAALDAERNDGRQLAEAQEHSLDAYAKQRAAFWRESLRASLNAVGDATFAHPALREAVRIIESRAVAPPHGMRQKVLVFGRFTRPMRALEQLLNAREMLRRLEKGQYWPQQRVRSSADDRNQWPAVRAAHRQWFEEHGRPHPLRLDQIDGALNAGYNNEQNLRKRFRNSLVRRLGEAFTTPSVHLTLLAGLREAAASSQSDDDEGHPVALLARALLELTGDAAAGMNPRELGQEFAALVDAVMDNDLDGVDVDDQVDPKECWAELERRLAEEFGTRTGGFARLMQGGTKIESRRMIQQAFNRREAEPMVLIAQSLVGREGLNLHEACRVVVLLHPEWNPAVVEQQIGRVDRVGSRWAQEVREALREGRSDDLPRIEVLPLVFRDTYDEFNWRVLRERWDDLRAQLHGEVIPPRLVGGMTTKEESELLEELKQAAPSFSPAAPWRGEVGVLPT